MAEVFEIEEKVCIAANSKDEAIDWYKAHFKTSSKYPDVKKSSFLESIWNFVTREEVDKAIDTLENNKRLQILNKDGELLMLISLKDVLKQSGYDLEDKIKEPFVVSFSKYEDAIKQPDKL